MSVIHSASAGRGIRTVLFDLDGTLLDTAPDLADALNTVLEEQGCAPLPYSDIRPVVSHGGIALIALGFGLQPGDARFDELRAQLLKVYRENISIKTRPFPGMVEVLDQLEARDMNWGVVTNKPGWLTDPLLRDLELFDRAACIVSGDTLEQRKPHPAPMLHACEQAGSLPAQCVYVGDAQRDIEAGNNAGMHTLVALFGYIPAEDDAHTWQADAAINTPRELLDWLDGR